MTAEQQHFSFAGASFHPTVAHDGKGQIQVDRVVSRLPNPGCVFIDLVVVPPESTIGNHQHRSDEEIYVVIEGHGRMTLGDRVVKVAPGDVVVNPPGGTHALQNRGGLPMRLVVVDIGSRGEPTSGV